MQKIQTRQVSFCYLVLMIIIMVIGCKKSGYPTDNEEGNYVKVAAGFDFGLGIKSDRTLWAWVFTQCFVKDRWQTFLI